MNNRLKSLVKKIFIAATATISATPAIASTQASNPSGLNNVPESKFTQQSFEEDKKHPKLVFDKPSRFNLGTYLFASLHASHSSHVSHASHASHASGYAEPQTPEPKPQPTQNQRDTTRESPNQKNDNQIMYKLGSRVLKKNMIGTDVAELQELLIKKGYKIKITANYDSMTEDAVKEFQDKKGVEVTGEVDALTLFYLNEK